jgi:hypothetical protein
VIISMKLVKKEISDGKFNERSRRIFGNFGSKIPNVKMGKTGGGGQYVEES